MKNNKYLFIITLTYFLLGIVNIHFALLGFICMAIPLLMLFTQKKKTWCQGYCPRASLYNACGKSTSKWSGKTPKFFITGPMKWIMLVYFLFGMVMMTISTIGVAAGKPPYEAIKFLIFIPLGKLPQLVAINTAPWLVNLSYSFYSFMLTATVLGFVMALVYKPRTWCTICPIATISAVYINGAKKAEKTDAKKKESIEDKNSK